MQYDGTDRCATRPDTDDRAHALVSVTDAAPTDTTPNRCPSTISNSPALSDPRRSADVTATADPSVMFTVPDSAVASPAHMVDPRYAPPPCVTATLLSSTHRVRFSDDSPSMYTPPPAAAATLPVMLDDRQRNDALSAQCTPAPSPVDSLPSTTDRSSSSVAAPNAAIAPPSLALPPRTTHPTSVTRPLRDASSVPDWPLTAIAPPRCSATLPSITNDDRDARESCKYMPPPSAAVLATNRVPAPIEIVFSCAYSPPPLTPASLRSNAHSSSDGVDPRPTNTPPPLVPALFDPNVVPRKVPELPVSRYAAPPDAPASLLANSASVTSATDLSK
mmetsp:Transcript_10304/g.32650  ORF Transcript_10304/g.32650 Transcript_10304/m.32650 type:complete len:333 (-) Transcript_10304:10238-11236(-)